jgi:hypothetical protein
VRTEVASERYQSPLRHERLPAERDDHTPILSNPVSPQLIESVQSSEAKGPGAIETCVSLGNNAAVRRTRRHRRVGDRGLPTHEQLVKLMQVYLSRAPVLWPEGAADGFDLTSPHANMQLMAMSMFSDMYVSSARDRVHAGVKAAAKRGDPTGTPALGYILLPRSAHTGAQPDAGSHVRVKKKVVILRRPSQVRAASFKSIGRSNESSNK